MPNDKAPSEPGLNLRHSFVAMLFALTAGQIALSTTDLIEIWQTGQNDPMQLAVPSAHLILALVLLSASWVGWSVTAASKSFQQLSHLFRSPYVVLLIDVILVIVYFAIVRAVEIRQVLSPQPDGNYVLHSQLDIPSPIGEALGITIVCFIYLIWDVVHDVIMRRREASETRPVCIKRGLIDTFPSLVCVILSIVVCLTIFLLEISSSGAVISIDLALLALVIGFRALKGVEQPLAKKLLPSVASS